MKIISAVSVLSHDNVINLYRGCSHGCIYCDARSTVYQVSDFDAISVKADAIDILRNQLAKRRQTAIVRTGSMNDPYMHLEASLQLTRKMLKALYEFRFGVYILTKSDLVLRDIDLLTNIHKRHKAIVAMTLTTLDDGLAKVIEPHASLPSKRIACLKTLKEAR